MRDDSDFPQTKLFTSFLFSTKINVLNSPNINKNLLFELIVFCYFFRFPHMYIVCCGLIP